MKKSNSAVIIQRFLDAENARDWNTWSDTLHPKVEYEVIGSDSVVQGKQSYIAYMKQVYSDLYDWHFNIVNLLTKDNVVMVEFEGSGHFSGKYENTTYTKKHLNLKAVCIFVLEGNLIRKIREFWDPVSYSKQLKKR